MTLQVSRAMRVPAAEMAGNSRDFSDYGKRRRAKAATPTGQGGKVCRGDRLAGQASARRVGLTADPRRLSGYPLE
jgi:hypothetical protein